MIRKPIKDFLSYCIRAADDLSKFEIIAKQEKSKTHEAYSFLNAIGLYPELNQYLISSRRSEILYLIEKISRKGYIDRQDLIFAGIPLHLVSVSFYGGSDAKD